jgi:predicted ABC-type ATPase
MTMQETNNPEQMQQNPGIDVGDEIYVNHSSGPHAGRVVAHGAHGATIDIGGKHHKVQWKHVLGAKKRATQHYNVIDEGEDGVIVEDANGKRRFINIAPDAREDKMIVKALDGHRLVLFAKSDGDIKNRPGLSQKDITDSKGRHQKHWVRTSPDQPAPAKPGAQDDESGASSGYGTHNLQAGDRINFKAGNFEGAGEIVGTPGADGAHVKDDSGREHEISWSEVTGHDDKGGAEKPQVDNEVKGEQKPIPADQFSATDFAKSHDDATVSPESIISQFPADTAQKIKDVQARLEKVEQTIDQFRDGDGYTAERKKLHDDIMFNGITKMVTDDNGKRVQKHFPGLMSAERIAAATPADGEKPTFTILGGRGGSGKSWFEDNIYDPNKAIVLDADHIKGMMPEYEGWNAAQVHEESGEIFDRITDAARTLGLNVVHDATMKTAKGAIARVQAFKEAGYNTEAHYMHLPRQEAAKRAVSRFLGKTQRYVPVEVVLSNTGNEGSFDQVRKMVDKWSFRDNNVPKDTPPILISESGNEKSSDDATPAPAPGGLAKSFSIPGRASDRMILFRRKS